MTKPNALAGVNLNLFPVFDALMRTSNATLAAKELGVSQSAVSHSLRELRLVLGDALFVRTGRGLEATPRARAIEGAVRTVLESLGNAVASAPSFDPKRSRRTFTVATADETSANVVPEAMARLASEAPGVRVNLVPRSANAAQLLSSGTADLVFQPQEEGESAIDRAFLYKDTFSSVVRSDHPSIKSRLTLKQFVAHPHVVISTGGYTKSAVDEALAARGLTRTVRVATRYFMSAPEIVAKTDAILTMPTTLAHAATERLPLKVLKPPFALEGFTVSVLWNRARDEPGLRWLRELFCDVAKSSY